MNDDSNIAFLEVIGKRRKIGLDPTNVLLDEVTVDIEAHIVRQVDKIAGWGEHRTLEMLSQKFVPRANALVNEYVA